MLAYAANRPAVAERRSAPNAMLAIVAIHVAGVAALMSAKIDLPTRIVDKPIDIDWIEPVKPPPEPVEPTQPQPRQSTLTRTPQQVPLPTPGPIVIDPTPRLPDFAEIIGPRLDPVRRVDPIPTPAPVKAGPRLTTPSTELRPPYPAAKLASGEEAVLRLNLTIDERGRVIAVEPVGRADGVFLEAARRHLLAHWRYKPATEDGRAVRSSISVTLRFRLEA
jgi:protein TonB